MLETRLDFRRLDTPFPYTLAYPQVRTEELLERRAADLGVRILRGHAVTGLTQDGSSVTLEVEGPDGIAKWNAAYVVGCDGAAAPSARPPASPSPAGTPPRTAISARSSWTTRPTGPGPAGTTTTGVLMAVPLSAGGSG